MDYPFIADILTRMVGATLIMADIYGVVQPFSMTKFFGLSWASEKDAVLFPGIGARNTVVGLAALILSFTGQRGAAGILLTCAVFQGVCDASICWRYGDKWVVHALNVGIIGLVGVLGVRGGQGDVRLDQALLVVIAGLLGWQMLRPTEGVKQD